MKERLIFVANNEKNIVHLLEYVFVSKEGYNIKAFSSHEDLIANIYSKPDVVVIGQAFNICMDTLKEIKHSSKEIPVIILSEKKEEAQEIKYIENGAYQCISQSGFFVDRLLDTVDQAIQTRVRA
jgi:DNA-binding NtrC family response regulator